MHGATIKIINAQQARLNNIYKNTKLKLLKHVILARNYMCSLMMISDMLSKHVGAGKVF